MSVYSPEDRHGTLTGYEYGCRCDACVHTRRIYNQERTLAKGGVPRYFDIHHWKPPRRVFTRDELKARKRIYNARWRSTQRGRWSDRDLKLRRAHNIDSQQYDSMLAWQRGCCAICGTTSPGGRGNSFHVDHDHGHCPKKSCGRCIRGLLCTRCNLLLGKLEKGMGWVADPRWDQDSWLGHANRYLCKGYVARWESDL